MKPLRPSAFGLIYLILTGFAWGTALAIAFGGVLIGGCDGCSDHPDHYNAHLATVTHYLAHPTRTTPEGVRVTDPKNELDLEALDRAIDAAELCLVVVPEPTDDEWTAMECLSTPIARAVNRAAFDVLVAPDWYQSTCTGQEMFPCAIADSACDAKPQLNDLPCRCACRAAVQQNRTIVVVPNAAPLDGALMPERDVFRGELLRLVTGCSNPWRGPLGACAQH